MAVISHNLVVVGICLSSNFPIQKKEPNDKIHNLS